jgi:uncharacterized protein YjfI (DUF2170 family)
LLTADFFFAQILLTAPLETRLPAILSFYCLSEINSKMLRDQQIMFPLTHVNMQKFKEKECWTLLWRTLSFLYLYEALARSLCIEALEGNGMPYDSYLVHFSAYKTRIG